MAQRQITQKRGTYRPRRGFQFQAGVDFSRKYQAGKMAYTANRKASLALSMLNSEKKFVDLTAQTPGAISAGAFTLLNPLSQGTANGTRVGDQVRFTDLDVRLTLYNTPTNTAWVRIMIIKDMQPNGAAPTLANLLSDTGGGVVSFRNLDYGKRFRVYADRVYSLMANDLETPAQPMFVKFHVDLKGTKKKNLPNITEYGLGNAGTIADISKGAYYLVSLSNLTSSGPTVSFNSRMKYVDN